MAAKKSPAKEEYFLSRLSGQTADEFARERELTPATLQRLRKKWGISTAEEEGLAIEAYRQSLPAPQLSLSVGNTDVLPRNLLVRIFIPVMDTKLSSAESLASAEASARRLAEELRSFRSRATTVEQLLQTTAEVVNALMQDMAEIVPPFIAARKVRTLVSRSGAVFQEKLLQRAHEQGWEVMVDS